MDKTRANKGGGGKGNQTLEELELELDNDLLVLDQAKEFFYEDTPPEHWDNSGIQWNNTGVSFPDAEHPLSPACPSDPGGYDLEAAQTIVKLSIVGALRLAGCERRSDAVKAIMSACNLDDSQARRLFNKPWSMRREHADAIALATKSTLDDLRGVDLNIALRREATRLAQSLSTYSNLLRGDSLAAAVELLRGAEMAVRALCRCKG